MGVTNRNKVRCKNSERTSSTESLQALHIPANSESSLIHASSVDSIPIVPVSSRRQKRHKAFGDLFVSLPRHVGRRRQRRLKAVAELSALLEEEEPEEYLEEGIPHNSLFTIITNNPDLENILEKLTNDETKQEDLQDHTLPRIKFSAASYKNISFHVKVAFKIIRSVNELERTETELLDFFTNAPEKTYINGEKSSFQRLLIHGISQYYCFKSKSYNGQDGKRIIKVENPNKYCIFLGKRLFAIVQDNHNKRI